MVQLRDKNRQAFAPDQLGSYIRVSKPAVWMTLGAIAALLVAGVVWFFAGTITENAAGPARVQDGTAFVYVPLSKASRVQAGQTVRLEGSPGSFAGEVVGTSQTPVALTDVQDAYGPFDEATFGEDTWAIEVEVATEAPDGSYSARVELAEHRPIRLLFGLD